jgi:hypothetical protein
MVVFILLSRSEKHGIYYELTGFSDKMQINIGEMGDPPGLKRQRTKVA